MPRRSSRLLSLLCCSLFAAGAASAAPDGTPDAFASLPHRAMLEKVADFGHQVTGVTVSGDARIFVNFPRWTEDSPVSVAELKAGAVLPFPNED